MCFLNYFYREELRITRMILELHWFTGPSTRIHHNLRIHHSIAKVILICWYSAYEMRLQNIEGNVIVTYTVIFTAT